VKLSTGEFTIEQAADYFMKTVPLDRATAMEDATFYASVPEWESHIRPANCKS